MLLQRQDELRQLEDELEEMDKVDNKSDAGRLRLASREMDERARSELLHRIEEVALRYGFSSPFLLPLRDEGPLLI